MIINADCIDAMREMDADSIDAIVCDPPYGLEFMGKEWDRLGATAAPFAESLDENGKVDYHGKGNAPFGGGGQRIRYGSTVKAMQEWHHAWATEALRILKPGAHLLAFGGTRTYHRLACAVEDAGFEIRDSLIWLYGSGFPKSLDVSKAIDKAAGAEREVVGTDPRYEGMSETAKRAQGAVAHEYSAGWVGDPSQITAPATPEAQRWQGWGTALKPAHEPIVVARKPLTGTVAANVLEYGTGALNVDGCRVATDENRARFNHTRTEGGGYVVQREDGFIDPGGDGRWPANALFSHLPGCERVGTRRVKGSNHQGGGGGGIWSDSTDGVPVSPGHADPDGTEQVEAWRCEDGCPVAELDRQSGEQRSGVAIQRNGGGRAIFGGMTDNQGDGPASDVGYGDTGGASRFFATFNESRFRYCPKASRAERNAGLGGFEERKAAPGSFSDYADVTWKNHHPTVKPLDLMRWLCRLVTPPGGTVLDPFTGSGTTGAAAALEGFNFIGIEREAEYAVIAEARVKFWAQFPGADVDAVLASDAKAREIEASGQMGLL